MERLRQVIKNDAVRYGGGISAYCLRPTFRVIFWYRIVCALKTNTILKYSFGLIPYLIFRHLEYKYGIFLNTNIHIGSGLYIEHGGSIYLNASSIGNNFSVFHEVTLGASTNGGIPKVGNNVTCYMGAKIFGNINLGDNCIIGANAVVNKDVESGSTVVGIPARQINNQNDQKKHK